MGNKTNFSMTIDRILANHSGLSGVKCKTCGRVTTKAQLSYSMRFFGKPLCRSCQSLESYRTPPLNDGKKRNGYNPKFGNHHADE